MSHLWSRIYNTPQATLVPRDPCSLLPSTCKARCWTRQKHSSLILSDTKTKQLTAVPYPCSSAIADAIQSHSNRTSSGKSTTLPWTYLTAYTKISTHARAVKVLFTCWLLSPDQIRTKHHSQDTQLVWSYKPERTRVNTRPYGFHVQIWCVPFITGTLMIWNHGPIMPRPNIRSSYSIVTWVELSHMRIYF